MATWSTLPSSILSGKAAGTTRASAPTLTRAMSVSSTLISASMLVVSATSTSIEPEMPEKLGTAVWPTLT